MTAGPVGRLGRLVRPGLLAETLFDAQVADDEGDHEQERADAGHLQEKIENGRQRKGQCVGEGRVGRTTPEIMWVVDSAREEAAAETEATAAEVTAALWAVPDPEEVATGVDVAEPR